jgi:hypothetical protein
MTPLEQTKSKSPSHTLKNNPHNVKFDTFRVKFQKHYSSSGVPNIVIILKADLSKILKNCKLDSTPPLALLLHTEPKQKEALLDVAFLNPGPHIAKSIATRICGVQLFSRRAWATRRASAQNLTLHIDGSCVPAVWSISSPHARPWLCCCIPRSCVWCTSASHCALLGKLCCHCCLGVREELICTLLLSKGGAVCTGVESLCLGCKSIKVEKGRGGGPGRGRTWNPVIWECCTGTTQIGRHCGCCQPSHHHKAYGCRRQDLHSAPASLLKSISFGRYVLKRLA